MEEWKDIYFWENGVEWDFRGLYQVSNFGNVKSLNYNHTKQEKILKVIKDKDYLFINLRKNNKTKKFQIHRLVAYMFLTGYFENAQVNHIDENKENNHVSNLEWCNRKENCNHGTRNERISKKLKEVNKGKKHSNETKKKMSKAHEGKNNSNLGSLVARYSLDGKLIDFHYNFEYVKMGFNATCISACCKGKLKTHKKFIFKYYEGD